MAITARLQHYHKLDRSNKAPSFASPMPKWQSLADTDLGIVWAPAPSSYKNLFSPLLHFQQEVAQLTGQLCAGRMSPKLSTREGPLYVQIADQLREEIGALHSGARIPSEPQLAKDWGVSRFTVAKAVEQLVDEGLITRRQGSGTFVAEAPLRRAPGYLLSFTEAVRAAGHRASHQVLAFEPVAWHDALPYPAGKPLMLIDRLRLVDGVAVARHRSILAAELMSLTGLTRDVVSQPSFSLYGFFEARGLSVHSATERLIACTASNDDRKLLGLKGDAVVVAVTRHSFAADGTPLDAVSAIYDARRYSYEARLVRQHQPGNNSNQEKHNEDIHRDRRGHIGPRLGPWGNQRDGG